MNMLTGVFYRKLIWDLPTQITEEHWITELENGNKFSKINTLKTKSMCSIDTWYFS